MAMGQRVLNQVPTLSGQVPNTWDKSSILRSMYVVTPCKSFVTHTCGNESPYVNGSRPKKVQEHIRSKKRVVHACEANSESAGQVEPELIYCSVCVCVPL